MDTKYKHLNCEERILIQLSLERGCTIRVIARSLYRCPSSISRELARNQWCGPRLVPATVGRPTLAGGYRAVIAHYRASSNRSRGRKLIRLASDGYFLVSSAKVAQARVFPSSTTILNKA
jgi:IS30 family transposase